jgi:hypothetical protein
MNPEGDRYSEQDTEQRLRKTLRAAFNMPLKEIPRKRGKVQPPRSPRAGSKPAAKRARA